MNSFSRASIQFLTELFGLLLDSFLSVADWTSQKANAYLQRVWSLTRRVIILFISLILLYVLGAFLEWRWLALVSFTALGLVAVVYMAIIAPIWIAGDKIIELLNIRRYLGVISGLLLGVFLTVGLLLSIPSTTTTLLVVPFLMLVLGVLFVTTGIGPNPKIIYYKLLFSLMLAIIWPFLQSVAPETLSAIGRSVILLDYRLSDTIHQNSAQTAATERIELTTLSKFDAFSFFDREGEPLVSIYRPSEGSCQFYNGKGKQTPTGDPLQMVTPSLIRTCREILTEIESNNRIILEREKSQSRIQALKNLYNEVSEGDRGRLTAVAFLEEGERAPGSLARYLTSRLSSHSPMIFHSSFFRPAFFSNGDWQRSFSGDNKQLVEAGMFAQVKYILLASLNKSCRNMQTNKEVANMPYVCRLDCGVVVYDNQGSLKYSWEILTTSPGFSEEQALTLAGDKLISSELLPRLNVITQTPIN